MSTLIEGVWRSIQNYFFDAPADVDGEEGDKDTPMASSKYKYFNDSINKCFAVLFKHHATINFKGSISRHGFQSHVHQGALGLLESVLKEHDTETWTPELLKKMESLIPGLYHHYILVDPCVQFYNILKQRKEFVFDGGGVVMPCPSCKTNKYVHCTILSLSYKSGKSCKKVLDNGKIKLLAYRRYLCQNVNCTEVIKKLENNLILKNEVDGDLRKYNRIKHKKHGYVFTSLNSKNFDLMGDEIKNFYNINFKSSSLNSEYYTTYTTLVEWFSRPMMLKTRHNELKQYQTQISERAKGFYKEYVRYCNNKKKAAYSDTNQTLMTNFVGSTSVAAPPLNFPDFHTDDTNFRNNRLVPSVPVIRRLYMDGFDLVKPYFVSLMAAYSLTKILKYDFTFRLANRLVWRGGKIVGAMGVVMDEFGHTISFSYCDKEEQREVLKLLLPLKERQKKLYNEGKISAEEAKYPCGAYDDLCCNGGDPGIHPFPYIFENAARAPYGDVFHGLDAIITVGSQHPEHKVFIRRLSFALYPYDAEHFNKVVKKIIDVDKCSEYVAIKKIYSYEKKFDQAYLKRYPAAINKQYEEVDKIFNEYLNKAEVIWRNDPTNRDRLALIIKGRRKPYKLDGIGGTLNSIKNLKKHILKGCYQAPVSLDELYYKCPCRLCQTDIGHKYGIKYRSKGQSSRVEAGNARINSTVHNVSRKEVEYGCAGAFVEITRQNLAIDNKSFDVNIFFGDFEKSNESFGLELYLDTSNDTRIKNIMEKLSAQKQNAKNSNSKERESSSYDPFALDDFDYTQVNLHPQTPVTTTKKKVGNSGSVKSVTGLSKTKSLGVSTSTTKVIKQKLQVYAPIVSEEAEKLIMAVLAKLPNDIDSKKLTELAASNFNAMVLAGNGGSVGHLVNERNVSTFLSKTFNNIIATKEVNAMKNDVKLEEIKKQRRHSLKMQRIKRREWPISLIQDNDSCIYGVVNGNKIKFDDLGWERYGVLLQKIKEKHQECKIRGTTDERRTRLKNKYWAQVVEMASARNV
jgi:hypothetical protein